MYDFIKLCQDYHIPYDAQIARSRGFLAIPCPYCRSEAKSNKGYYGAIHMGKIYFNCWKCGVKPINEVIHLLTGMNWDEISIDYKTILDPRDVYLSQVTEQKPRPKIKHVLPRLAVPLTSRQKAYLLKRGFHPDRTEEKYKLLGTGPVGSYKFRIIIPIFYQGEVVSFQGRDYTDKSDLRYKACKMDNEKIHHKYLLYGYDDVPGDHAIVVEGIMDKWKMGDSAVATFGTAYTPQQRALLTRFKRVTVLFDPEDQARAHANKLAGELSGLGVETDLIFLSKGDPGDLSERDARELAEEILEN